MESIMDTENFSDHFEMTSSSEDERQESGSNDAAVAEEESRLSYICNRCEISFSSRYSLRDHNRTKHIMRVDLKSLSGEVLTTFNRDPITGNFSCQCGCTFLSTTTALKHRKCYMRVEETSTAGNLKAFLISFN